MTTPRTRRFVLTLALVGTIAGGMASSTPAASSESPVPVLDWADCGDGFECATATLPLDHRRPRRGTIDVPMIRHRALDPANRIGTLFAGHPSGTIDAVRNLPPPFFGLLARFDIVGYDGRGSGPTAVDCGIDEALLEPFGSNATRPATVDEAAIVAAADEYARRCRDAAGDLLPHLSTAAMVRDLDLLREAVGDERLTYAGMSQGADIGATYASMFPGRARAMILDVPIDVAGWRDRPLEIWQEQDNSYEQSLDRFFAACAGEAAACGFGDGRPEDAFDALVAALDASPIESSDPTHPGPVDGDDVRTAAADAMLSPRRWADLAAALVLAQNGDGALIQAIVDGAIDNELALDSFIANHAATARYPRRTEDMFTDLRHRYGLLDHFWARGLFVGFTAQRWPVRPRDGFDGDIEQPADAATILVIGTTHDPATPYRWAERLTEDLGNARLLTYRGDGHGAISDANPCIVLAAAAYLADPSVLPPEGTVCEQVVDPF